MGRGTTKKWESRARADLARRKSKAQPKYFSQSPPSWINHLNSGLSDCLRYTFKDTGVNWEKQAGFYTCELPGGTICLRYSPINKEYRGKKIGYDKKLAKLSVTLTSRPELLLSERPILEGLGGIVDDIHGGIAHVSFRTKMPSLSDERETVVCAVKKIETLVEYFNK
ncbi:MAG: hypothetical protein ABH840_02405 [Nanoarchaeota archaeon]